MTQSSTECASEENVKAWLERTKPYLYVFTQKKLVDFFLKEDYSYSKLL